MKIFEIDHVDEGRALRISTPTSGVDGLILCVVAVDGEFALSLTEVDLLADWLYGWAIDRDRRGSIRIEG